MSLMRQFTLLLAAALALTVAGAWAVSVQSAKRLIEQEWARDNLRATQSLARNLPRQRGNGLAGAQRNALDGAFSRDGFEQLDLFSTAGETLYSRHAAPATEISAWCSWLPALRPAPGWVDVTDDHQQPLGRLQASLRNGQACQTLSREAQNSALRLILFGLAVWALSVWSVLILRRPLDAVVSHAKALTARRLAVIDEAAQPAELRHIAQAMNTMVERVRLMFDEQANQISQLRHQANCDALTGLFNRAHFISRLKVALGSEDGQPAGALMLIRLADLHTLNQQLGRVETDQLLQKAAQTIAAAAQRVGAVDVGRLNSSDFGVILSPLLESLREPAIDVLARLKALFDERGARTAVVVGTVRWHHDTPLSTLLAAADQALARAEARGRYAVEISDTTEDLALGEDAWRQRLDDALAQKRICLIEYPVIDARGRLVHRECPLRVRLADGEAWLSAAHWLPMARRAGLTVRADTAALALALHAIEADGVPRAVNISPISLLDSQFVPAVRQLLERSPAAAARLWLELPQNGAMRFLPVLRELAAQAHAHGVKVGLEHAGETLIEAQPLIETGLDFVKLDASITEGLAQDSLRRQHVASIVGMLHGLRIAVYAEGVAHPLDAAALWECQIDGMTGPAVSTQDSSTA